MVLVVVSRVAGPGEQWPKTLKEKSEKKYFRQLKDLLYSPTKKSQLTLYPGDVEEVRLLKMMTMR
jgi:uracil DNA glycosylase